jgi:hypothetical protein
LKPKFCITKPTSKSHTNLYYSILVLLELNRQPEQFPHVKIFNALREEEGPGLQRQFAANKWLSEQQQQCQDLPCVRGRRPKLIPPKDLQPFLREQMRVHNRLGYDTAAKTNTLLYAWDSALAEWSPDEEVYQRHLSVRGWPSCMYCSSKSSKPSPRDSLKTLSFTAVSWV